MKVRTKTFDAVAESRKWKEAVAEATQGMTVEQTLAYFDRATVRRRFQAALRQAEQVGHTAVAKRKNHAP
mgnify:CR=1 FL=1